MKKRFLKEDLIKTCRDIYKEKGVSAFIYKNMDKTLYFRLYHNGIKLQDLLKILDIEEEFNTYKLSNPQEFGYATRIRWTWEKVLSESQKVVDENNYLPPAGWFNQNGYKSLVQAVYNLGKTWENLRDEFKDFENSSFVTSRNGMRWRSHPEASLSNFLYTRGINHDRGKKYPDDYSEMTGQTYGYYDLHFETNSGKWVDIEIWGDKPHGHAEEHYAYKRKLKENYNKENNLFLGIEFYDCYNEKKLIEILEPHIGDKKPTIFEKNYDKVIPSTHWSNADELIEYCKDFANKMPDKIFPSEGWLRKRNKWKNREGETYNTLAIYIQKWIGGIKKLRAILEQDEVNPVMWNKELALTTFCEVFDQYGLTPNQIRSEYSKGNLDITKKDYDKIMCLKHALEKFVGSTSKVYELTGIKPKLKGTWNYRSKNK